MTTANPGLTVDHAHALAFGALTAVFLDHNGHGLQQGGRGVIAGRPGEPTEAAGRVVAWLWLAGHRGWLSAFAHDMWDDVNDTVSVDDFAAGVLLALPSEFPEAERKPLLEHLRATTEETAPFYLA